MSNEPRRVGPVEFASTYVERDTYVLWAGRYISGDVTALWLTTEHGEPAATLTVNLVGEPPAPGHVWIKTWSENEGVLAGAVAAGIVGPSVRTQIGPYGAIAYECPVLMGAP